MVAFEKVSWKRPRFLNKILVIWAFPSPCFGRRCFGRWKVDNLFHMKCLRESLSIGAGLVRCYGTIFIRYSLHTQSAFENSLERMLEVILR